MSSHNRREMSSRRVEDLLRDEFSREIEAQVPDWRSVTATARLIRRSQASIVRSPAHRWRD